MNVHNPIEPLLDSGDLQLHKVDQLVIYISKIVSGYGRLVETVLENVESRGICYHCVEEGSRAWRQHEGATAKQARKQKKCIMCVIFMHASICNVVTSALAKISVINTSTISTSLVRAIIHSQFQLD